jgi:hypothetical protein
MTPFGSLRRVGASRVRFLPAGFDVVVDGIRTACGDRLQP